MHIELAALHPIAIEIGADRLVARAKKLDGRDDLWLAVFGLDRRIAEAHLPLVAQRAEDALRHIEPVHRARRLGLARQRTRPGDSHGGRRDRLDDAADAPFERCGRDGQPPVDADVRFDQRILAVARWFEQTGGHMHRGARDHRCVERPVQVLKLLMTGRLFVLDRARQRHKRIRLGQRRLRRAAPAAIALKAHDLTSA